MTAGGIGSPLVCSSFGGSGAPSDTISVGWHGTPLVLRRALIVHIVELEALEGGFEKYGIYPLWKRGHWRVILVENERRDQRDIPSKKRR